MAELLLEIGTEEIPARMLAKAVGDLKQAVEKLLREAGLAFDPLEAHAAPRQLLVYGFSVAPGQEDREETVMGPPVRIAYDAEGRPTRALEGFLKNNSDLSLETLFRVEQKKGEVVAGKRIVEGRSTSALLAEALPAILTAMHFPKTMRWGACRTRFVRPVRNLLALLDGEVIPFAFGDCLSGNSSFSHRLFDPKTFTVRTIKEYLELKKAGGIVVSHEERRTLIMRQIKAHLQSVGGRLVPDEALLREVTDLVETPHVVLGAFDSGFLKIPKEVLITSLRDHQKSFAIQNEGGELLPHFLSIANMPMIGDPKGLIKKGNEWVLNARLYDAKFFWESDLKKDFEKQREKLENLMFQAKIGSYRAKTERIAALTETMATYLHFKPKECETLAFASRHCKTDLVSEMVFEFPELQGITGGLLLKARGREPEVYRAIYDHYLPQSMDDELPRDRNGALISIADKLDTLTGFWAIDEKPTGSKDPYALRRAALGVIRLALSNGLRVHLDRLVDAQLLRHQITPTDEKEAALLSELLGEVAKHGVFGAAVRTVIDRIDDAPGWLSKIVEHKPDVSDDLLSFFHDRLKVHLRDEGMRHDVIDACLAMPGNDDITLLTRRAQALGDFLKTEEGENLVQGFKRANNILSQAEEKDGVSYEFGADKKFAEDPSEEALFDALQEARPQIDKAMEAEDFAAAMTAMAGLRGPIDAFFEAVQVNAESEIVRRNRLNLLSTIRSTCLAVADLTRLEG